MKKNLFIVASLFATTLLFSFKSIEPSTWSLDRSHSNLRFSITHLMVNDIEGGFSKFESKITATKEDLSDASLTMSADAASIFSGDEKRDGHLKTADFFDVEKYPTITFKSTSFTKSGENNYKIIGDLTMHGVTKSIVLEATIKSGKNPMSQKDIKGCKIIGTINRADFDIASKMPSMMLSNEVAIVANAEFSKN